MFLFEIALTIAAWRRGWRAKALLPLAYGLGVALVVGFCLGLAGFRSVEPIKPLFTMIDIGILCGLVAMAVRRPRGPEPLVVRSSAVPDSDIGYRKAA